MDDDLTRLGSDALPEVLGALPDPDEDTYMPSIIVQAQRELAAKSHLELAHLLADVAVAIALRLGGTMTPKRVYAEFGEACKITDESFLEKVGPELRRVLAKASSDA